MHVILTHEHADFDALASVVAAAKLYPDAIPLAPRHLNQNVHDFLILYGDEFSLVDHADRPHGKIKQITLVDTQYVPGIKGRTAHTQVHVIDHHTPTAHLKTAGQVVLVDTGANITYLVEQLAAGNIRFSPIEATLFLLGLYEDCGSLTYNSTTPRDIRAAAWLLERGARLDTLRAYLNYALTPAQKRLYNALINTLETHTIHGRQILIAAVAATEEVPEISSLAHKLRDLYNPEGLFLVVGMGDHVQVVARSTSDEVHVGAIAERLGGGGHARAAAAHIGPATLEQVHTRLLQVLAELVQPAATVRQIMSFGVRTLTPQQTIYAAAAAATRYGYEGYPVVDDGRLVGIITRREIDKAIHHQLGQRLVQQLMHAGEIFVSPTDSLDYVQRLMMREKLGQIPVMEAGEIIGVVTRTDLINFWVKKQQPAAATVNLAAPLEASLAPALFALLKHAGELAEQGQSRLYLVGGVVRDLLLRRPLLDIDLVVEGEAIPLAEAMQAHYGGRVRSHQRFGTANWLLAETISGLSRLDFVTARTEFYRHPTALPEVEQSSIKQDLHRRDFTINTLAIRLDPAGFGELLDFYGGYTDLQQRLIRVLHSLSFVEDPTRIIRAIRLEQRLGFSLGKRTLEHLLDALDLLPRVSPERVWAELEHTLAEQKPEEAMRRLSELGVLAAILLGWQAGDWFAQQSELLRSGLAGTPWAGLKPTAGHYLGLLTYPLSPAQIERLKVALRLPAAQAKILQQLQTLRAQEATLAATTRPSEIYRLLAGYEDEALLIAWLAFTAPAARANLVLFKETLAQVLPWLNGAEIVQKFRLRPSPLVGELLALLRAGRLDGDLNSPAEAEAKVAAVLAERGL